MTVDLGRRQALIGAAMAVTAVASELHVPRRSMAALGDAGFDRLFPRQIGEWAYLERSGLVLPPEDQLSRALYEQLVTRTYATVDPSRNYVMMVVAYSSVQEGRLQVHRPEVCYPSAGFTIISNVTTNIALSPALSIPGRFLVADRGPRRECVLYWTRVGPAMPMRWVDQRLMMARANLQGYIPDGLLGRVSLISSDVDGAVAELSRFVSALVMSASAKGRLILLGPDYLKRLR